MYDKGYRQNVIDVIASIERSSLVKVEAKKTVSVQDIDNNFKHNLISCVAKRLCKMAFARTYQNDSHNLHKYKIHKKGFKGTLGLQT